MTDDPACTQVRQLIPDLAAGVAAGDDRVRAMRHLVGCATCRRELDEAVTLMDDLLSLAPEREPAAGFDAAVLRRLAPPRELGSDVAPSSRRPRRVRRALLATAAAAAVAGLAGGSVWQATADDRRLAQSYRKTLAAANGQYFTAQRLLAPDGSVAGRVFAYQGNPSWIFVTVTSPGPYRVLLRTRDGIVHDMGTFTSTSWGTTIEMAVHTIVDIRLSTTGSVDLVAVLAAPTRPD